MNGNSMTHIGEFDNSAEFHDDIFRASARDLRNEATLLEVLVFLKNQ
jgi:hypothetical protein